MTDFDLRSKTEGLKRTGPKLDRDRSGPFSGTDGLGSAYTPMERPITPMEGPIFWDRSGPFFGLPYLGLMGPSIGVKGQFFIPKIGPLP